MFILIPYLYRSIFHNSSGFLIKDPLHNTGALHSNISKPYIELPPLTNCSDSANLYRDYLKTQLLNVSFLAQHNISLGANLTTSLYDKWNQDEATHGNCTYGSGNAMIICWLRIVQFHNAMYLSTVNLDIFY